MHVACAGIYDEEKMAGWVEWDLTDGDVPVVWDCARGSELVAGKGVECADEGGRVHLQGSC